MVHSGELKQQIIIQIRTRVPDDKGGTVETWTTHATVWAGLKPSTGNEFLLNDQVQSRVTTEITIRYRKKVTTAMRVNYGGRIYDIEAVIDPKEKHEKLLLMCREET